MNNLNKYNLFLMTSKSIFIIILFLFPIISLSQQLPLHNQYIYNPLIINPSFAGISGVSTLHLTTRSQWIGFSDGINTISFSGNYALSDNQGVGGTIFQDNTGAITITGMELDYSFKFPLFLSYNMSLGLGLTPYQYLYNSEQVNSNIYDPVLDPI